MKNLTITLLFFSSLNFVIAQNNNVPATMKVSFSKAFKNVSNVTWQKEGKNFEVSFTQNGNKMSADINANGKVEETETELKTSSLSPKIIRYMKDHYSKKELIGAAKITNSEGVLSYEAAIKGKDVFFDANGNFLKELKN
jgi:hypothetical protein